MQLKHLNSNIEIHKFHQPFLLGCNFQYLNSNIEIHKLQSYFQHLLLVVHLNSNIEIHKYKSEELKKIKIYTFKF